MKKLVLTGILVLLFSCKPTDVTIIVTVDTQELYNSDSQGEEATHKYTALTDDYKDRLPKKGIKYFRSKVWKGHHVTWVGVSESPEYTVAIDAIEMTSPNNKDPDKNSKRYANFFDTQIIPGRGGKHSIVRAKIRSDLEYLRYYYTIKYSIHKEEGNDNKPYQIDPKLKAYH